MIIDFICTHYPDLIASSLGSLLYMMIQDEFHGWKNLLVFLASFIIGFQNGNIITLLIQNYLPYSVVIEKALGCFICSLLTIPVSRNIIIIAKNAVNKDNHKNIC